MRTHLKTFLIFIVSLFAFLFVFRNDVRFFLMELQKPDLPSPVAFSPSPSLSPAEISPTPAGKTPESFKGINLDVPFSSQAPAGDWSLPYQEACEETSALLVHRYFSGGEITQTEAISEINKMVDWQMKTFGYYEHTTAEETAEMLREFYGYKKVEVRYDFTADDVRNELIAGRPVIVGLAGRLLGNPYYTSPGPVYHMLVVKGMTKDGKFITNDVGTRRGKDYVYDLPTFMNAAHDVPSGGSFWPAGVDPAEYILSGRRSMIIVHPN